MSTINVSTFLALEGSPEILVLELSSDPGMPQLPVDWMTIQKKYVSQGWILDVGLCSIKVALGVSPPLLFIKI